MGWGLGEIVDVAHGRASGRLNSNGYLPIYNISSSYTSLWFVVVYAHGEGERRRRSAETKVFIISPICG